MPRIDSFLRLVADQQASDLHLHAGNAPVIRHNGELIPLPFRTLTERETRGFLVEVLSEEQRAALERDLQLDWMYALPGVGRFRANAFTQRQGLGAVFRFIPSRIPSLDELMFPPALEKLTRLSNGLVLVTGPTGSGKTTTLAALVEEINRRSARHIITIEDPIEYLHEPIRSVITHREVGRHTESFASGLRAALREAPHVVVVGELRDLETIQLALSAAETGVLVFGTLHTNSAAKAVHRILDAVPEDGRDQTRALLSVVLRGVVAQHLCLRANGEGRIAALEIMLQNYAVANMIRENKIHQLESYLLSAASDSGMQALDTSLFRHVEQGFITLDEALKVATHPDQLRRLAEALPDAV